MEESRQLLQPPHNKSDIEDKGQRLAHAQGDHLVKGFRLEESRQLLKIMDHVDQPKAEECHPRSEVKTLTVKQQTTSTEKF